MVIETETSATPPTIDVERLARVQATGLRRGGHLPSDEQFCVNEAVAWVTHAPWSDQPSCMSPVIAAFTMSLNDNGDDAMRAHLLTALPRLVGTAAHADVEHRRSLLALDWLIRVYTPTWLRLVPALGEHADALATWPPLTKDADFAALGGRVRLARAAARAAAWDAASAALRPTVEALQVSALGLLDAMIVCA